MKEIKLCKDCAYFDLNQRCGNKSMHAIHNLCSLRRFDEYLGCGEAAIFFKPATEEDYKNRERQKYCISLVTGEGL